MRVLIIRNHWVNIAKKYMIFEKKQNKKYPQKQAKKPP